MSSPSKATCAAHTVLLFSNQVWWLHQKKVTKILSTSLVISTILEINAKWVFFATSHGKSSCDGIGGTVKRLVKRASLQTLSSGGTILNVQSFFNYCQKNIDGIIFEQLNSDTLQNSRQKLEKRFHGGSTIPGTRSYHLFEPIGNGEISFQYVAADKDYAGKTSFFGLQPNYTTIQPLEFAACK